MNKKAMLGKLDEIEASIKAIRDMLEAEPAGDKAGDAGAAGEGDDEKNDAARIACPKCGSLKIIKHVDKGKVLYYHQGAPIYAKKGICSQCGAEMPL